MEPPIHTENFLSTADAATTFVLNGEDNRCETSQCSRSAMPGKSDPPPVSKMFCSRSLRTSTSHRSSAARTIAGSDSGKPVASSSCGGGAAPPSPRGAEAARKTLTSVSAGFASKSASGTSSTSGASSMTVPSGSSNLPAFRGFTAAGSVEARTRQEASLSSCTTCKRVNELKEECASSCCSVYPHPPRSALTAARDRTTTPAHFNKDAMRWSKARPPTFEERVARRKTYPSTTGATVVEPCEHSATSAVALPAANAARAAARPTARAGTLKPSNKSSHAFSL
mmetsp:Transcript_32241/g.108587  ORF Transcript_32241/g.108587 Transcript_32241/m.108587 type:complete len:283 (+) Transcript_32241:175-1023(+)